MTPGTWRVVLYIAVSLFPVSACRKDQGEPVATLIRTVHSVERRVARDHKWARAESGAVFFFESGVRTGPAARAVLRLAQGGELVVTENTEVHFQRTPTTKGAIFDIETGAIELESKGQAVPFDVAFGMAVLDGSGKVRLEKQADRVRLSMLLGQLSMETKDGQKLTVPAGQNLMLDFGGVVIEEKPAPQPVLAGASAQPTRDPAPEPATTAQEIAINITGKRAELREGDKWTRLPAGEREVAPESVIRLGKKTRLTIRRDQDEASVDGIAEVIVAPPSGALVHAELGTVTLSPRTANLAVTIPGGRIEGRATPSGSTVVAVDASGKSVIKVRGGTAAVRSGETEEVLEGSGTATLSRDGKLIIIDRIPTRADVTIALGESPTIHDGKPPTAVRVRFTCAGEGMLEVTEGSGSEPTFSPGRGGGANVLLAPGAFRYRVICDGQDIGDGRIVVKRDSARKMLPQRPASTTIEADGRPYLVMYQNHLPVLSFNWRNASPGPSTFHLNKVGGESKSVPANNGHKTFRSGEIQEGAYQWWFEAGGRRSPQTRLTIDFDNAAGTAYLSPPVREGNAIEVRGAAILGSKVTAQGVPVELDRHQRFRAKMGDKDVLPIRIVHPRQGLHYYIVRASQP